MSDIALEELQGAQEESDNRRIVSTISAALLHGGPRGRIGELDISGVQTNVLDRAIATAMELGCVSEEAELLLATAKFVRRLRSVLQTGKWDFVEQMMVAEQGVDYHRAAIKCDMIAKARIVKLGRVYSTAEAEVYDPDGKMLASGRGTFLTHVIKD